MPPIFKKLDEYTLQATTPLGEKDDWGNARIRRIFNFLARDVTVLYERGGKVDYKIPGHNNYVEKAAAAMAVTSSMTQRSFSDFDSMDEIIAMHAKLKSLGGTPPAIDDLTNNLPKKPLKLTPPS